MATKLSHQHTSGLFSDMTVDGPEIGTLVLIVDRAKNLPNRKTMGKQNPYCAARLGKEAKKTDTDRRGGQTPRWDQELRFTVHDSPDYYKAKISIFSEDKKTDLIGEAWIDLSKIVTPGGGKADLWQGLNCKGKYAGELRIELTYYDTRPKPDPAPEAVAGMEELSQSTGSGTGRVKRRPLPSNPNSGHVTPDMIGGPAAPGRAKHGPRDFNTPPRANSMPPETMKYSQLHGWYEVPAQEQPYGSYPGPGMHQTPPNQYHGEFNQYQEPQDFDAGPQIHPQRHEFLPELPPSNRQRNAFPRKTPVDQLQSRPQPRPISHIGLPHSNSAPMVPQAQADPNVHPEQYQLRTDYPEPIPDLDYQHQHMANRPRRNSGVPQYHHDPYAHDQPYGEERNSPPPPPPPMHTHSAPVVPHFQHMHGHPASTPPSTYSGTPPSARHNSFPNSSPLQNGYPSQQRTPVRTHPARGGSVDAYTSSPEQYAYESPPSNHPSAPGPSPYARAHQPGRGLPHRHSMADAELTTPPRPHPLSQEVPRPRSPQPPYAQGMYGSTPNLHDYRGREAAPSIKPRALSPQPAPPSQSSSAARPKSSYSIQHPVRAFESSDTSPLSTSRPSPIVAPTPQRPTVARKSISPHPTGSSPGGVPFSPDSFDIHNPNARAATLPEGNSPHKPYHVQSGPAVMARDGNGGPIVNWHGQEIDPSDHLPVDSWAPEPEKKTPTKTYGLGRDRDFGPRTPNGVTGSGPRNLSKDTIVNFRTKSSPVAQPTPEPEPSSGRNRLQKKSGGGKSPVGEPLRERHNFNSISVPDPYAQQEYIPGFHQYGEPQRGYNKYAPASTADTLAHEISNIDIGSGRHSRTGSVPSPTAYVPVRSHRDRNTFY